MRHDKKTVVVIELDGQETFLDSKVEKEYSGREPEMMVENIAFHS